MTNSTEPPATSCRVEFDLTRDDWPKLRRQTRWLQLTLVHWIYFGCYCLPLLVLASWTAKISLVIPVAVLIVMLYRRLVAPLVSQDGYDIPARLKYVIAVEENALRMENQYGWNRFAPWTIDVVRELDDSILIAYLGYRWILGIPNAAFASDAERNEFLNQLRKLCSKAATANAWSVERDSDMAGATHVATYLRRPEGAKFINILVWVFLALIALVHLRWISDARDPVSILLLGGTFHFLCGGLLVSLLKFCGLVARQQFVESKIAKSEQRFGIAEDGLITSTAAGFHLNWWKKISEAVNREKAIHVLDTNGLLVTLIPEDSFDDPQSFLTYYQALRERIYESPIESHWEAEMDSDKATSSSDPDSRQSDNPYAPPDTVSETTVGTVDDEVRIVEFTVSEEQIRRSVGKHHSWIANVAAMTVTIVSLIFLLYQAVIRELVIWEPWLTVPAGLVLICGLAFATLHALSFLLRPRMLKRLLASKLMGPGTKQVAVLGDTVWLTANGQTRAMKLSKLAWKKNSAKAIGLEHRSELLVIPEATVSAGDYRYLQNKLKSTVR